MEMTLEGGFTLQRTLPRRVAGWITIAEGVGWMGETENANTFFFARICYHQLDFKKIVMNGCIVGVSFEIVYML